MFETSGEYLQHTVYFNMKDSESILDAVKVILQVPKDKLNADSLLWDLRNAEIRKRLDILKKRDLQRKEKV